MAEIFDDIRPKKYWTYSSNWNDETRPDGDGTYWSVTIPQHEGDTSVTTNAFTGGTATCTYKSDRYRAGRGSAVAHIQSRLNAKRVSGAPAALVVDGVWGSKSKAMTEWFQNWVNTELLHYTLLSVDGVVGSATWGYLA